MKLDKKLVIAIDGPAGAGKSTVAKIVADKLQYIYVDTGAMYRAITLEALNNDINLNSAQELTSLAKKTDIKLKKVNSQDRVLLNGTDVTDEIRTTKVSSNVSLVAKIEGVRHELVKIQQKMAAKGGIVMDGRDIGTVVLPNADLKVFLTASVEERTKRRFNDVKNKDNVSFEQLKEKIIKRDRIDKNRDVSPLKKAVDAVEIDTTNLDIDQVVDKIIVLCREV